MGDPREVTPAFIREALLASVERGVVLPARDRPARAARGDRRAGSTRRFGVEVDEATEIVPTLGSKEAIFSFAQIALGEKRLVAVPEPGYPVYERGALFAGGEVVTRAAAGVERLAARPRRVRRVGRDRALLGLLPEQPDRRRRAALVLRGARRRVRASTASCSAPTRRTRSCGSTSRRSSALQVADRTNVVVFNTLSKRSSMTGLPLRLRLRAGRDRRCAAQLPPDRRHGAAGVRAARVGGRLVGRGARRGRAGDLPRKRETLLPALESARAAARRLGGDVLPLARGRRAVRAVRAAAARARHRRRARLVLRRRRARATSGFALVPTQAECERAAEILRAVL